MPSSMPTLTLLDTISLVMPRTENNTRLLRVAFYVDMPKVFIYRDQKDYILGHYAHLLEEFAIHNDYKLLLVDTELDTLADIYSDIEKGYLNIAIVPAVYQSSMANMQFSYPVELSNYCVVLPLKAEMPHFWYVIDPFDQYVWYVWIAAIVYVAFLMRLIKHPTSSFTMNLLSSLALLQASSNAVIRWDNANFSKRIFYTLIFLLGYMLLVYYSTYITSFFMKPIFQAPIQTIKEIRDEGLQIAVSADVLEELQDNPNSHLELYDGVLVKYEPPEFRVIIGNFNRTTSFILSLANWKLINNMQKHLIQPFYRYSDLCFGQFFTSFPASPNDTYMNQLNQFIMECQQHGLWYKWREEAYTALKRANFFQIIYDDYVPTPLDMEFFLFAWIILFGGSILSSCCFALELLIQKRKNIRVMDNQAIHFSRFKTHS